MVIMLIFRKIFFIINRGNVFSFEMVASPFSNIKVAGLPVLAAVMFGLQLVKVSIARTVVVQSGPSDEPL